MRAVRILVDELGQDFFAGAALAQQQNGKSKRATCIAWARSWRICGVAEKK